MSFSELEGQLNALGGKLGALVEKNLDSVLENYVLEDYDEKMLEVMQNYEYDYEKIAQDIFRGKIGFPISCREKIKYAKLYSGLNEFCYRLHETPFVDLVKQFSDSVGSVSNQHEKIEYEKIKYEKGILMMGDLEIKDVNNISKIFDILVECLTEHGEYLKRYLQKKAELDEKLGFLDEEDTNIDENKTDDLF